MRSRICQSHFNGHLGFTDGNAYPRPRQFCAGVPMLARLMLARCKKIENPFPHLRRVLFSGTQLDAALAKEFADKFSAEVVTGYGMTEAVPVTMALDMAQVPEGSVGSVARELQLRISSRRRATQSFPPK